MLQDEYVKAYYAALLEKQKELEAATKQQEELSNAQMLNGESSTSTSRQVGVKSKRADDEGEEDVEWEEAPVAGNSNHLTSLFPILKLKHLSSRIPSSLNFIPC